MKIRQKLMTGFMGVVLLIGLDTGIALYHQNKIIRLNLLRAIRTAERKFLAIKERDTKILSSALEVFIQDQSFKSVYLEKDREKLYTYGQPLFQELKHKYGITHFYFILPDGHCFVRLHNKEIYGDMITRFTFSKARDTKAAASGIELGKTAFALRVVMPYYNNNELIGYVELGEEIDHFLEILKGTTYDEFAIIADKENLDREKWKSVRLAAGLRDSWDDLGEHVVISDTSEKSIEAERLFFVEENLERIEEGENFLKEIRSNDKLFAGGGFELIDAGGRHAGAILSLIDMTDQIGIARSARNITLMTLIILVLIAISTGFLVSRSISRPIMRLKDAAFEIGRGNLGTKIDIKSRDEIKELADSFNAMALDLKKSREKIKSYSQDLEHKVAERTEEIRAMNEELHSTNEELKQTNDELQDTLAKLEEAKAELEKKYADKEAFHKLVMGREKRVMELKEEVERLKEELRKYKKA